MSVFRHRPRTTHRTGRWRSILRKLAGFVASMRDPYGVDRFGAELDRALSAGPAR